MKKKTFIIKRNKVSYNKNGSSIRKKKCHQQFYDVNILFFFNNKIDNSQLLRLNSQN